MKRDRAAVLRRLDESTAAMARWARSEGLDRSYAPGKWTARQVLAHLADVEIVNAWRLMKAAGEPGSGVEVFDENAWAVRLDYAQRPAEVSAAMIAGARAFVRHIVATATDEVLDGACIHPEKREMSGWAWADLIDAHARHHLTQIEAAVEGKPWVKPPPTGDSWKFMGKSAADAAQARD